MEPKSQAFVLCIDNEGWSASLRVRKVYPVLEYSSAAQNQMVRVVDESGEDYLYPEACFVPIELPRRARGRSRPRLDIEPASHKNDHAMSHRRCTADRNTAVRNTNSKTGTSNTNGNSNPRTRAPGE